MKQTILFEAYQDKKDTILIYYQGINNTFYVNKKPYKAKLIKKEEKYNTYEIELLLDFNTTYIIEDSNLRKATLKRRYIVKSKEFDDYYFYDKNDLGATYSKEKTTFKVWAPLATEGYVKYILDNKTYVEALNLSSDSGVFELTIYKDLEHALYHYLLKVNDEWVEVNDPYGYSCNANSAYSAIINQDLVNIDTSDNLLEEFKDITKAIICEANVRDFSSDNSLGKDVNNTFLAFTKENMKTKNQHPIGLDYLSFLGITHLQLMPILDFITVDENDKKRTYNWGYDPASYSCLEGSYSTNPNDPYVRIIEAKQMIRALHKRNIRVVLDLVFNHFYYSYENILNQITPYYFLQVDDKLVLSNGSFCGNDYDSNTKMGKKYLVDMAIRYVKDYHVDGYRMDLMGILDIDTIQTIYNECKAINPSFILYGEGWNMPTLLNEAKRATLLNANKLYPIAFFNDYFRETVKGKSFDRALKEKGYVNGNLDLAYQMVNVMKGSLDNYFKDARQSINYIECHDNATLHDKLEISNEDLDASTKNNIVLMSLCSVLFSLGVPFLHMGCEFHRTKKGNTNSYNLDDHINAIDWKLVDTYFENCLALKGFIRIRKKYNVFSLHSKEEIEKHFHYQILDNQIVKIFYKDLQDIDGIDELIMFINPTNNTSHYNFYQYFKFICSEHGPIRDEVYSSNIVINPYSFSMYIKEIERK